MTYKNLQNTIIQALSSANKTEQLDEAKKPTNMQIHKVLYPTKNAREGIAALKKAFRVNDTEAKKMLDRVMNEENELSEGGHEDKTSAMNKVKIAMSALQKMQTELSKLPDDADLPSWWVGKVAIAVDKLDGMADYLDTQVEQVTEEIDGKQLVHHGEKTKNFEICPSALKAFNDNQKAGMGDKDGFHEAVVAVDKYLGIEKDLTEKGSATEADMDKMKAAVEDAKQKIKAAGLPGHDYHGIHIKAVEELMKDEVNEKTLTPAEKKKREEVAQAIERDNPGMPMDKKMAIATATAKRVAEENVDELSMSMKDLQKTGLNKAASPDKDKLKKDLEKLKKGVNEISSNKLGDYMRKSAADAAKPGTSARQQDKRIGGQKMADDKIRKKMGKSSSAKVPAGMNTEETVNEISIDKMSKYASAARKDIEKHRNTVKTALDQPASPKRAKAGMDAMQKLHKRSRGSDMYVNKMTGRSKVKPSVATVGKDKNVATEGKARDRLLDIMNKASGRTQADREADAKAATASRKAADKDLKTFRQTMKEGAMKRMSTGDSMDTFKKKPDEKSEDVVRRGDYTVMKVKMPDGSIKFKKKPRREIDVD